MQLAEVVSDNKEIKKIDGSIINGLSSNRLYNGIHNDDDDEDEDENEDEDDEMENDEDDDDSDEELERGASRRGVHSSSHGERRLIAIEEDEEDEDDWAEGTN